VATAKKRPPIVYHDTTAHLSGCGTYRYSLTRSWEQGLPWCLFVMLNPSTADATVDDPTIRRCVGFARDWGYGRLHVVNLFGLRATDPKALRSHEDPVGPDNDSAILRAAARCELIVAAWGAHGSHLDRNRAVWDLLGAAGLAVFCLGTTEQGHPKHPLYLKTDLKPVPFILKSL
jgi:hypothetical protein